MATKSYRFEHKLDIDTALARLMPVLDSISLQYSLEKDMLAPQRVKYSRSGVDADVQVTDKEVVITVDLSWFLEKVIRSRVEDSLHKGIPPLLRS